MEVITSLENFPTPSNASTATLGNFDGVHIGHQEVIRQLTQKAKETASTSVVISFSNHPSQLFNPSAPAALLSTIEHKVMLIERLGVDILLLLPFTKEFSSQEPESFLGDLKEKLNLVHLIFGSDTKLGKNRKGDRAVVEAIGKKLNFSVTYLEKLSLGETIFSSSEIRRQIQKGNLLRVEELLGRKLSFYGPVIHGKAHGRTIGYPTANIAVEGLCLPPFGIYVVTLKEGNNTFPGVANLGRAPTIHKNRPPLLEVHLLEKREDFYDKTVEVTFLKFLRAEEKFSSSEKLTEAIASDVKEAKLFFEI